MIIYFYVFSSFSLEPIVNDEPMECDKESEVRDVKNMKEETESDSGSKSGSNADSDSESDTDGKSKGIC